MYFLSYAGDLLRIDKEETILKNKIDKITQQVGRNVLEVPTEDDKGIVTYYEWETPNVAVLLISYKSAAKENNYMSVSVKEK